jgi:hypothetical protein
MALSREAKARAFGAVLKDLEQKLAVVNVDRAKKRKRKPVEKPEREEKLEREAEDVEPDEED